MTTKTITMLSTEIGADGETLEAGSTYELNWRSAEYWLVREKAVLVEDMTKVPTSKKVATPKSVKDQIREDAEAEEAEKRRVAAEADAKLKAINDEIAMKTKAAAENDAAGKAQAKVAK